MVHVHSRRVQQLVDPIRQFRPDQVVAVAVDAGKASAVALVATFSGERLFPPFTFAMNRIGIADLVARVEAATAGACGGAGTAGVEASGYHLPLLALGVFPAQWGVVVFNPAHVAEQRKVNGKRGVKTDVVDATAMFDLLEEGRGCPVGPPSQAITELAAWSRYRLGRVAWRQDVEHPPRGLSTISAGLFDVRRPAYTETPVGRGYRIVRL